MPGRSATEPIDDTSTGKLMEGVLAAFAQFDNDVRSDRTRAGMKAALELRPMDTCDVFTADAAGRRRSRTLIQIALERQGSFFVPEVDQNIDVPRSAASRVRAMTGIVRLQTRSPVAGDAGVIPRRVRQASQYIHERLGRGTSRVSQFGVLPECRMNSPRSVRDLAMIAALLAFLCRRSWH